MSSLFPSFKNNIDQIKKHSQLFWAIFVAGIIACAFILIVYLFVKINDNTQERLIDLRISTLQDSISSSIESGDLSKEKIDLVMSNLIIQNPTIMDFTFYEMEGENLVVLTSSDQSKIGQIQNNFAPAAQLALLDSDNSYTSESRDGSKILFQTFRPFNNNDEVVGLIKITQSFAGIDGVIDQNIKNGIGISIFIILLVMFFYFKYIRVIDRLSLYEEFKKIESLKNEFILMGSEKLKGPIATIIKQSKLILNTKETPKKVRESAGLIEETSRQLELFVNDMSDVLQIEHEMALLDFQKVLLPEFIKNLLPDYERLAKAKKLVVSFEYDGLMYPFVSVDKNKLQQCFTNIIENSITYTEAGDIKISLRNLDKKIEIKICDTRIGMSDVDLKHFFDKFYKFKSKEINNVGDTGLGLWISKQLIEKMGGAISVKSNKEAGVLIAILFEAEA